MLTNILRSNERNSIPLKDAFIFIIVKDFVLFSIKPSQFFLSCWLFDHLLNMYNIIIHIEELHLQESIKEIGNFFPIKKMRFFIHIYAMDDQPSLHRNKAILIFIK